MTSVLQRVINIKPGSDNCKRFTHLCNILQTDLDDETCACLNQSLADHEAKAAAEFDEHIAMNQSEQSEGEGPSSGTLHLVFDFAEKVLLSPLLHQPRHDNFVTGLRFDLFGV